MGQGKKRSKDQAHDLHPMVSEPDKDPWPGWGCLQLPAGSHRSQAGCVCVTHVLASGSEEVLGQRGGGSGEKLESTREVPQVGGRLIAAGKEKGGQAQLLGEVEGLDQDWGLWAGQG